MSTNKRIGDPGTASVDSQTIIDEVSEWYLAYMEAFSARDLEAIAQRYVSVPYTEIAITGEIVVHSADDAVEKMYRAAFEYLESENYGRTVVTSMAIRPLSDNSALLAPKVRRYAADGSLMLDKSVVYLVRRSDAGWRIGSYAYISEGFDLGLAT